MVHQNVMCGVRAGWRFLKILSNFLEPLKLGKILFIGKVVILQRGNYGPVEGTGARGQPYVMCAVCMRGGVFCILFNFLHLHPFKRGKIDILR